MNYKETIVGQYVIREYESGTIVKTLKQDKNFQEESISLEKQLQDIKNTIDLLLLKQEGLI